MQNVYALHLSKFPNSEEIQISRVHALNRFLYTSIICVSGGHFWNPHCTFLISYFSEVIYTYLFQNEFSPFYLPENNMYEKEDAICLVIHQESNNKPKTKCSIECGMYLRFNYVSPYPLPYAIWGIGWRNLSFHDHFNWRSLFMDKFYRFWESI